MPKWLTKTAHGPLEVLHGVVTEQSYIHISCFEHLQSLPHCFHTSGSHAFSKGNRYVIMRKKRTEFPQAIRSLTGDIGQNGIWKFLQYIFRFLSFRG
ncbi:hypothetical protein EVA_20021 [gut metagenome]|uniref:Uncharacterized protein n=1 Tax=gut metagenome TaxID=749906 RepID=J9FQL7_9ZZZZ